jgi:hypothetical protein
MRFLREGEQLRIKLPVTNQNADNYPLNISIEPASMRSEVEFRQGEVLLKPAKAGFKQFSVIARLAQGLSRTESFAFEALPASWSKVLLLGDGLRDPEITGTLKVFQGAQVMNPLMQEIGDRALALRQAVVLGTSLFSDGQALAAALPAIQKAKLVVIQTPMLERVPADVASLLSRMGFQVRGRFESVFSSNAPRLQSLPVTPAAGSGLASPSQPLSLSGSLTPESANPMLLNPRQGSECRTLVQMTYQSVPGLPGYELPLAVKCESQGRRFVVSGIEWADLAAQAQVDQKTVSFWLEEILK